MQPQLNPFYFIKFAGILAVLLLLFYLDISVGSISISFTDFCRNIFSENEKMVHAILWQFRFPKALTCVLAGAGLAASGLLMQTLFRNPLVDHTLHVDLNFEGNITSITIVDLMGNLMMHTTSNEVQTLLPVYLNPGLYVVTVANGSFKQVSRLLVK